MDGGEAGVAGALAGCGAVDGDAEGGEGVERDGGLVVLHVVAAEEEDLPGGRHGHTRPSLARWLAGWLAGSGPATTTSDTSSGQRRSVGRSGRYR